MVKMSLSIVISSRVESTSFLAYFRISLKIPIETPLSLFILRASRTAVTTSFRIGFVIAVGSSLTGCSHDSCCKISSSKTETTKQSVSISSSPSLRLFSRKFTSLSESVDWHALSSRSVPSCSSVATSWLSSLLWLIKTLVWFQCRSSVLLSVARPLQSEQGQWTWQYCFSEVTGWNITSPPTFNFSDLHFESTSDSVSLCLYLTCTLVLIPKMSCAIALSRQ